MYRLARYGNVQPIGSLQTRVNIEGRTWELWVGMNGSMKVFSFVAASPVNSFNSDVKQFFNYLARDQGFPASRQYLLSMYSLFIKILVWMLTLSFSLPIRYRAFRVS